MPSLQDIRKRIRSVESSQKITKAMKLVAASKLRRAQAGILEARPYAIEIGGILKRVARSLVDQEAPHPLLEVRPVRRVLLVVITSDRGLCGGFNANLTRRTERFVRESSYDELHIATIGKKGRDFCQRKKLAPVHDFPGVVDKLSTLKVKEIGGAIIEQYAQAHLDAVFLLYNEFKSVMTQNVVVERLLPVAPEVLPSDAAEGVDHLYEPSQGEVLQALLPRYIGAVLWRALLESAAAEHAARVTAMDAASKKAKELGDELRLFYNRTRQASITRELMEIVAGAEALKS